jgi:glucan phosphoethanolaminetransferase (alkaline phosphatase superfamily)
LKRKEEQTKWTTKLWKFFAQGILFSVIFIYLSIEWVFLFFVLMLIGSIIVVFLMIICFVILLYLIGLLNVALTVVIWNTDTREDWTDVLLHGFVLFIALTFAQIPCMFLINLVMHSLPTIIALFIVYCFIDGFVSKTIAGFYKITDHEHGETTEYETPTKPPWVHNQ